MRSAGLCRADEAGRNCLIYIMVLCLGLTCDGHRAVSKACPRPAWWWSQMILQNGDRALRRRSGEHSTRWECVFGRSTLSLGSPGELLTQVWVPEGHLEYRRCLTAALLLARVPVGSPGLCRDQQGEIHRVSAQGQPQGAFRSFPFPSAEAVREENEGS